MIIKEAPEDWFLSNESDLPAPSGRQRFHFGKMPRHAREYRTRLTRPFVVAARHMADDGYELPEIAEIFDLPPYLVLVILAAPGEMAREAAEKEENSRKAAIRHRKGQSKVVSSKI